MKEVNYYFMRVEAITHWKLLVSRFNSPANQRPMKSSKSKRLRLLFAIVREHLLRCKMQATRPWIPQLAASKKRVAWVTQQICHEKPEWIEYANELRVEHETKRFLHTKTADHWISANLLFYTIWCFPFDSLLSELKKFHFLPTRPSHEQRVWRSIRRHCTWYSQRTNSRFPLHNLTIRRGNSIDSLRNFMKHRLSCEWRQENWQFHFNFKSNGMAANSFLSLFERLEEVIKQREDVLRR